MKDLLVGSAANKQAMYLNLVKDAQENFEKQNRLGYLYSINGKATSPDELMEID